MRACGKLKNELCALRLQTNVVVPFLRNAGCISWITGHAETISSMLQVQVLTRGSLGRRKSLSCCADLTSKSPQNSLNSVALHAVEGCMCVNPVTGLGEKLSAQLHTHRNFNRMVCSVGPAHISQFQGCC